MFDIEDLVKKSDYIQSLCINKPGIPFGPMPVTKHSLPLIDESEFSLDEDNWNLDEKAKATISKYLEELRDYADVAIKERVKEVLPPWVVFPLYSSTSMGWRMGWGETYMDFFRKYIKNLKEKNPDEYEKYVGQYPRPKYLDCRLMGYDV